MLRIIFRAARGGFYWWLALTLFAAAPLPAAALKLRVGIYENIPKVFMDQGGQPQGIFIDILNEIAAREKWEIDYVYSTWSENIQRLEDGKLDLMVDMSYSPGRAQQFMFSAPVLESWLEAFSLPPCRLRSIQDLKGKRIAVLAGSVQEQYLREEISPIIGAELNLLPYVNYSATVEAIKNGCAELMVADRFMSFSPLLDERFVPSFIVLRPAGLHFACPRGADRSLVYAIDRQVAAMKNDMHSVYYASLRRWLDIQPRALIPPYIKWMLAAVCALLAVSGLFVLCLRRQVRCQTRALRETSRLLNETQAIARLGGWQYEARSRRMQWTGEMYRIYGVDRDYDINDFMQDARFHAEPDAAALQKSFKRAVEAGEPFSLELGLTRLNEDKIWVRITGQPVKKSGRVLRVNGNVMDITAARVADLEKQKLRERLIIAQKMEAMGRLAGGVAHDFNNMLGVIIGYTEQALERVAPRDELHDDLDEIYHAAVRATDITRQLLAFSRKQTSTPKTLNLNTAVESSLKLLRRLIGENIELAWRPAAEVWPVLMDPVHVDQILANLCVNARDAIADTGRVVIETGTLVCDAAYCAAHPDYLPGEYVWVSVSDDGCGMPPAVLAQIFEPFYTTKLPGKGTGLGLATIQDIVRQYRGMIKIESQEGRGTTVKIFLPRQAAPSAPAEIPAEAAGAPPSSGTILLVEDEEMVLKLISHMLSVLGYKVLTANSPQAALERARTYDGEIQLVITDVVMPGQNGRKLAESLAALRPGLRCLFMSGYSPGLLMLNPRAPFIQKPFLIKELEAKIRVALNGKD